MICYHFSASMMQLNFSLCFDNDSLNSVNNVKVSDKKTRRGKLKNLTQIDVHVFKTFPDGCWIFTGNRINKNIFCRLPKWRGFSLFTRSPPWMHLVVFSWGTVSQKALSTQALTSKKKINKIRFNQVWSPRRLDDV